MGRLEGKVAVVTGGGRGIGRAVCLAYAKEGADVVVNYASKDQPAQEVVEMIKKIGRKAIAVKANVAVKADAEKIIQTAVDGLGKIDILVNNAATNPTMASSIDVDERTWDSIMNLNLKGLFFLSQAVARVMRGKGGGKIINVASVAGITPDILPLYSISKAGVIMATKVMAREWAQYNIRVNAIAPGLTKTRFSEALWKNPDILQMAMSRTPLARPAEPEEMVGAMIYLASDASSYVTGQVIALDGGMTI